jgi:hypothetical protein
VWEDQLVLYISYIAMDFAKSPGTRLSLFQINSGACSSKIIYLVAKTLLSVFRRIVLDNAVAILWTQTLPCDNVGAEMSAH